jgi:hypothetical protein
MFKEHWFPRERSGPCVYFYARGKDALYVGQTEDVLGRLAGHQEVLDQAPTGFYYLALPGTDALQREAVEGFLIHLLRPLMNSRLPGQYSRDPSQARVLMRMLLGLGWALRLKEGLGRLGVAYREDLIEEAFREEMLW